MSFAANRIQFNTGTGAIGTTIDVAHGLGVTPAGMILWFTGQTGTTDVLGRIDHKRGFGIAISTSSRAAVATQSDDTPTTMATDRGYRTDCVLLELSIAGAAVGRLDVNALDSTNIQFIIDAVFAANYRVQGFVFGGTDITNTFIGEVALTTSVTTQDVTSPGFTVTDDEGFIFAMSNGDDLAPPSVAVDSRATIGCATSASKQWCWGGGSNDGAGNAQALAYCKSGQFLSQFDATVVNFTGAGFEVGFNGWITNGFQLNVTDAPTAASRVAYLVVKGGRWQCGNFLTQTDTTTDITVSSLPTTPVAGLLVSACRAESTASTGTDNDELSIGCVVSDTVECCSSVMDDDANATARVSAGFEGDACYLNLDVAGALEGRGDCRSVTGSGWTFRMDDADPAQAFVGFLAAMPAFSGFTGTGALSVTAPTVAGAGLLTFESTTGALSVPAPSVAGSGLLTFTGTGALSVAQPVVASSGLLTFTGTSDIQVPAPSLDGSGTVVDSGFSGSGALSVPAPLVEGSGLLTFTGTGALDVPIPQVAGTAALTFTGTGSLLVPHPTIAGAGLLTFDGIATLAVPVPSISGTGTTVETFTGTATLTVAMPLIAGTGNFAGAIDLERARYIPLSVWLAHPYRRGGFSR